MELTFDISTWLFLASLVGLIGGVGILLGQREERLSSGQPSRGVMLVPAPSTPPRCSRMKVFRRKQPSAKDSSCDDDAALFMACSYS
jgi:hypothetical protein